MVVCQLDLVKGLKIHLQESLFFFHNSVREGNSHTDRDCSEERLTMISPEAELLLVCNKKIITTLSLK